MNWYKRAQKEDAQFSAILKKKQNGFYYLDIPQAFASSLFGMLDDDKAQEAPYKQKSYGAVGAHVSAISEEELDEGVEIKEVGKPFSFSLTGAKCVDPETWDEMNKVCFIEIESSELKDLRTSYGLPKTYKGSGHNFHITFAVERA